MLNGVLYVKSMLVFVMVLHMIKWKLGSLKNIDLVCKINLSIDILVVKAMLMLLLALRFVIVTEWMFHHVSIFQWQSHSIYLWCMIASYFWIRAPRRTATNNRAPGSLALFVCIFLGSPCRWDTIPFYSTSYTCAIGVKGIWMQRKANENRNQRRCGWLKQRRQYSITRQIIFIVAII